MDAITTSKIYKQIPNITKFDSLKIVDNGLIFKHGKKQPIEILFSELDNIYIMVYQSRLRHLSILIPIAITFLYIEYAKLDISMFMAIFPVFPLLVKAIYFRRFALIVRLKEGTLFRKNICVKTKFKTIEHINEIKNQIQNATDTKINFQFGTYKKITFPSIPITDKRLFII